MYLGAGISTWTVISSSSRMKEQIMLDLNSSSLIWEYWDKNRMTDGHQTAHYTWKTLCPIQQNQGVTFPSICVSLNTWVKEVICSFRIRSLLRTSMASRILLLTSREPDRWAAIWLGSWVREPLVKVARIYMASQGKHKGSKVTIFLHNLRFLSEKFLLPSQNSFPGCLRTAAQRSKSSSRHN